VEETREGFKRIQEVCSQVLNSEKLIGILEMVLNIGNLMNEGTLNGGVEAFKFESLSKLSQTKSADGKMTVLDYIVETFIEKGERDALNLLSEFPDIQVSTPYQSLLYYSDDY
jgi:survival motor neuron protein